MNALTTYLIESVACTGLAYIAYVLLLKKLKLLVFNRAYLLLALTFSLLAPALYFDSPEMVRDVIRQSEITKTMATTAHMQEQFTGELIEISPFERFSVFHLLAWMYVLVTSFFLVRLMVNLVQVCARLDKHGPRFGNMQIVYTDTSNPHSFFNYLFINRDMANAPDSQIVLHERAHGKEMHTLDILYSTVLSAFFWFNPFVWMMKRAIAENHEFLADDFVLRQVPQKETYAQSILRIDKNLAPVQLTSHFSYRLTKNRINMIFRKSPHPFKRIASIGLSMVLVIALFAVSACKVTETEKTRLVIIDPGHGGKDPGVKHDHATEKDINLAIAKKIKELAIYSNVEIHLTRKEDYFMSIPERSDLANAMGADLFLSLHASQAENTKNGMEVFVANDGYWHHHSEEYGKQLVSRLQAFESAPVALKGADFKILKDVQCPTVLLAVGFMSNEEDFNKLTNEDYQHQLAYEILKGLEDSWY